MNRILIIDDEQMITRSLDKFLKNPSFPKTKRIFKYPSWKHKGEYENNL